MASAYPTPIHPTTTRIGWIGTGIMGAAMATRLLNAGYSLTIYARTASKAEHLRLLGATLAPTPSAAALSADVLFTMVGHPSDVRSVLLDPQSGALASLSAASVLVDCTSSDPSLAREIAAAAEAKGCWAVDAPVSGGDVGARDGKLAIFSGGNEKVVEWLKPLFDLLGKATWMGPPGSGQSSKIANQITIGGSLLGLSEAVLFAAKSGLDLPLFLEAVRGGSARTKAMEIFGDRVLQRDFRAGGFVEYMVKDLGMALGGGEGTEEGERKAVALPGTALCQQLYLGMVANGDGKLGTQGLITAIERLNGKHN